MEMESNYEESLNSSHEQQGDLNEDLGVGRSYECVFCKRGFNTAQALGGHMNIHRKDRLKSKPAAATAKQQEIYTGPRFYQQLLPPSIDHHHHLHESDSFSSNENHLMSYSTYFQGSNSSTTLPLLYGNTYPLNQVMPGDWQMSLSLGFSPEINRQVMNQKEELDLELRLGYDS